MRFTRLFTTNFRPVADQIRWKTVESKILAADGTTVFHMAAVEVPEHWSQTATDILAQKYLRKAGVPNELDLVRVSEPNMPEWLRRATSKQDNTNTPASFGLETSAKQVFHRLAGCWTYWGWKEGYFKSDWGYDEKVNIASAENYAKSFYDEIYWMLANQFAAPNSPQWFNTGLFWAYGIAGPDSGQWTTESRRHVTTPQCWCGYSHRAESVLPSPNVTAVQIHDSYSRPQTSACFIQPVSDDLVNPGGIMDLWLREVRLFKHGSGTGTNFSSIRAKGESLSGGGQSSGLMSFLRIGDVAAGAIKSGGTCLAPTQRIYTEHGPVEVEKLAKRESFIILSFDPPAGRYKAKRACAWEAGTKNLVRITTDKGSFDVSNDHPIKLSSQEFIEAGQLREGMSLFACSIDMGGDHIRVHLRNGLKGKEFWHRMIARDVLGWNIDDLVVHHIDENNFNNEPSNLEAKTQSHHAREHNLETVAKGVHIFQTQRFPHKGSNNGMHSESSFWSHDAKVNALKEKQSAILKARGSSIAMQEIAATQKMLNTVFKVLNLGADKRKIKAAVIARFGTWATLLQDMDRLNHRVVSVEFIGTSTVYDVEVDCPTTDDKSLSTGHNFVIWPDSSYIGSGIAVANTRRAAKMVVLDLDHPEIEDFINWKLEEEQKAQALIEWAYSVEDAVETVSGQNSNNSVRVPDAFFDAIYKDYDWTLFNRVSKTIAGSPKASTLWNKICYAAWSCGDPGVQFHDTINAWNTCSADGEIRASNPCSEYLFLDNTACNLASLNLVRFLDPDGIFNHQRFTHAVRLWTTVLDISVSMSSFPSAEIALGSYNYRTLGLGYANLGGMLMRKGIAYDSNEGRAIAAEITSVMHAGAYATSSELARELGPFPRWEANKESMAKVIEKHRLSGSAIASFRNAQVTLIAPTGTIALLMDCDTQGIEPAFALSTHKKLAGGGTINATNAAVSVGLAVLGYTPSQIAVIENAIRSGIELQDIPPRNGLDFIDPAHLPLFATAVGKNALSPEAHVRMVAAVQPFLSGGVSKTVNMPTESTVMDVDRIYRLAHKMGLKSISIYRDGSKVAQPLRAKTAEEKLDITQLNEVWTNPKIHEIYPDPSKIKIIHPRGTRIANDIVEEQIRGVAYGTGRGDRQALLPRRTGYTHKLRVDGKALYLRTGEYPDGKLGEIFVTLSREGSTVRSLIECFAKSISIGLQYGVPLAEFVEAFIHSKFEPAGIVQGHDTIKLCSSIVDLIFRDLGINYAKQDHLATIVPEQVSSPSTSVASLDLCWECGNATLVRAGSCLQCTNCGANSGCG